ncbi:MAG: hypothetical protein M1823_006504, partial [Watsoniomyces obsoletus]
IGAGLLTTLEVNTGSPKWIGYQIIYGFGVGLGMQNALITVQAVLPLRDVPTGTAMAMFCQTFGGALFVSVAQNVFNNRLIEEIAKNVREVDPRIILMGEGDGARSAGESARTPAGIRSGCADPVHPTVAFREVREAIRFRGSGFPGTPRGGLMVLNGAVRSVGGRCRCHQATVPPNKRGASACVMGNSPTVAGSTCLCAHAAGTTAGGALPGPPILDPCTRARGKTHEAQWNGAGRSERERRLQIEANDRMCEQAMRIAAPIIGFSVQFGQAAEKT